MFLRRWKLGIEKIVCGERSLRPHTARRHSDHLLRKTLAAAKSSSYDESRHDNMSKTDTETRNEIATNDVKKSPVIVQLLFYFRTAPPAAAITCSDVEFSDR